MWINASFSFNSNNRKRKKKDQQDKQQQDKHHLERLEHFGRATLELKTRKYINTHEMWNTHMKCKIKIKLCH